MMKEQPFSINKKDLKYLFSITHMPIPITCPYVPILDVRTYAVYLTRV